MGRETERAGRGEGREVAFSKYGKSPCGDDTTGLSFPICIFQVGTKRKHILAHCKEKDFSESVSYMMAKFLNHSFKCDFTAF